MGAWKEILAPVKRSLKELASGIKILPDRNEAAGRQWRRCDCFLFSSVMKLIVRFSILSVRSRTIHICSNMDIIMCQIRNDASCQSVYFKNEFPPLQCFLIKTKGVFYFEGDT